MMIVKLHESNVKNTQNPVRRCTFYPDIEGTPEICSRPIITAAHYSSRKHWSVSGHVNARGRTFFSSFTVNPESRTGVRSAPTLNVHHSKIQSSRFSTVTYSSGKRWSVSGHVNTRDRIIFNASKPNPVNGGYSTPTLTSTNENAVAPQR